jgi:hypothetical protein
VLVSIGLAYWIGTGEDRTPSVGGSAGPPPAVHAGYAPPRPNADQVVRAYDQLQEIYADQGVRGVVDFDRACANSLRTDPGALDFCLAFDIYATSLQAEEESAQAWLAGADARDLDLARSALPPGVDAAGRLAQVRALARQASLAAPAPPLVSAQTETRAQPTEAPPAAQVRAKPKKHAASSACRLRATAAQRLVCANPALREADRRLRLTYRRAVDAGVDTSQLAHDQARFRKSVNAAGADRTTLARLYHRRTHTLELQIRRAEEAEEGDED